MASMELMLISATCWVIGLLAAWFATSANRVLCGLPEGIAGWLIAVVMFVGFATEFGRDFTDPDRGWDWVLLWGIPIGLAGYSFILLGWAIAMVTLRYLETHPQPTVRDWLPVWITPLFLFRTRRMLLWHLYVRLQELEEDIDLRERLERDWMAGHILAWSRSWTTRRHAEIMLIMRQGLRAKRP